MINSDCVKLLLILFHSAKSYLIYYSVKVYILIRGIKCTLILIFKYVLEYSHLFIWPHSVKFKSPLEFVLEAP